jgi:GT2 family glycosyltransferase
MVSREFPEVHLIRSDHNLGFAAANNQAFSVARGRYVAMLNSDAWMRPDALARSVAHMDANPRVALASGRLVDLDNVCEASGRLFPSPLNKFLTMSGLAERYRSSRFFARGQRTWSDPFEAAQVDWVNGAYMIVRRSALEQVGDFDESFFLYFEEVDLCRRIRAAGFEVWLWPDVIVSHVGGASTRMMLKDDYKPGAQVVSWRMRSELLYFRKYHGAFGAWCAMAIEVWWYRARMLRNSISSDRERAAKAADSRRIVTAMRDAWRATRGGKISPPRPWTLSRV